MECESDLQSEKYNEIANLTYKDSLLSVNSHKKLMDLIKAINHSIIKGLVGKSEFAQSGMHIILFKPGAPKPWEEKEASNYIRLNNPELLEAYNAFLDFLKNILREIKRHVKNSHQYKIVTDLSLEEKFSALAEFYNELKPILIKESPKMENFFKEYVSILHSSEKAHELIEAGTKKLFKKLNEKNDPYEIASYAHQMIVEAHAFEDGNGRTARLLMNLILQKYEIQPIIFYSNEDYSEIVKQSINQGNISIFSDYLKFLNNQRSVVITFYKEMQEKHDQNMTFEEIRQEFDTNKKILPKYKLNSPL